jgi:putative endonuclease
LSAPDGQRIIRRVADYYCYMIECADESLYTGWTTDPVERFRRHETGQGASYTRSRRPLRLVYVEKLPDRPTAMRRERAIKSLPRARKLALIQAAQDH